MLVLLGDLGYGDLGITGSNAIKTPAIDALANSGVLLNNYYAPAAVCTPSRAGLLTGRLPLRAGMPQVVHPSASKINWLLKITGVNLLLTSDNGPWFQGSAGSDRGRKADTFDGGIHVPMIVRWPEGIAGGRKLDGVSMGTDWFPTILDWLDLPLPKDRLIDGKSIKPMLAGGADSPHDYLYYFNGETLNPGIA